MAPLAGPSVGTKSFGRGENIGVVVGIPLAIVATLQTGQALDDQSRTKDNPDYSYVTVIKGRQKESNLYNPGIRWQSPG